MKMSKHYRRSFSVPILRVATFLACVALVSACHAMLVSISQPEFGIVRIANFEYFSLYYEPIFNRGISFGFFQTRRWISLIGAAYSLVAVSVLAITIYSVVDAARHRWQFALINLWLASITVILVEKVFMTGNYEYFRIVSGSWSFYVFSLPDALFWFLSVGAYLYAVIRFFHKSGLRGRNNTTSPGRLLDPFYVARHSLRALLVFWAFTILLQQVASILPDFVRGDLNAAVASCIAAVIVFLLYSLPLGFFWRLIPNRPIDVIFLRGFQGDRQATRILRGLRRGLGRHVRTTGVTNPRELPPLAALPIWLFFPIFALGDFSSANALRHNVFLVGHWQDGIEAALASSRIAVFDCGNVTNNLAWELQRAFQTLGPEALFLVYDEGPTPDEIIASFYTRGADMAILQGIPAKRWFTRDRLVDLSQAIGAAVGPTA